MVHINQSEEQAHIICHTIAHQKPKETLKGKCQIINVWRPIGHPVEDFPLVLSDFRTVPEDILVPVDVVMKDHTFEVWHVMHSDKIRFYYKGRIDPEEVYLIKCYNNNKDERGRYIAHTVFHNPNTPEDTQPHRSIQVRCVIFSHE